MTLLNMFSKDNPEIVSLTHDIMRKAQLGSTMLSGIFFLQHKQPNIIFSFLEPSATKLVLSYGAESKVNIGKYSQQVENANVTKV